MMLKKEKFSVVLLLLGILIGVMISAGKAEAAGVENLKENREYNFNLDGKGKFTVVMDRAVQADSLTGNHFDRVDFRLKDGKVSQLSDKTYYFHETYGSKGRKDKGLITAGKTIFYTGHSKSSKTFALNKGIICYPKKMYIEENKRVWVLFKVKNGKKGWLCTDDFSWEKHPFSDMMFVD